MTGAAWWFGAQVSVRFCVNSKMSKYDANLMLHICELVNQFRLSSLIFNTRLNEGMKNVLLTNATAYINYITIYSVDSQQHLQHLRAALRPLRWEGLNTKEVCNRAGGSTVSQLSLGPRAGTSPN